ncbi:SET domain-containing protein SmydA-8-like [Pollicipes pollicipes]|uniref:SET domain-containing protein SmydA-8-like n=1 Tax=Pollicipes pollicipes TaxID=41117 RepID=UPI00188552CE|nr:SET domain-containing protein SmydA-8-like [Pollicipes pollicipes]XP_037084091.1 SET domain-containing protein SmydA-8-like [Pollicipes pollicipes]XP_037084092.1 SET domain-containing protein SmydA-8-like [Pollicipes pollicipes]XP_037084093.1 SET domain-containing protein SmydA-8-like [Pollicipes pollicipes]
MPKLDRQCPVCGVSSSMACASCQTVHYCSRDHQKQHWKKHKPACKAWRVETTPEEGRFMVATRTIQPGDIILQEPPLIVGPKQATGPVCLGCHRPLTYDTAQGQLTPPAVRCPKCGWSLCRPDCSRWHSRDECLLWSRARRPFDLRPAASGASPVYGCVGPVRCLLLRNQPEAWASLSSMEHHLEERRHSALYRLNAAQLAAFLTAALPTECDVTEDVILTMCAVLDTNAFEVRIGSAKARAVYAAASLQNHDCRPNTRHLFDDGYNITVRATVRIAAGQRITTSYTQALWNTAARRQHLLFSKCFRCRCERCLDPTELNTWLSSLSCRGCGGPLVSREPLEAAAAWRCHRCGKKSSAEEVQERRGSMAQLTKTAERSVEGLEDVLTQLDPSCSQRAEVNYALVQLYGTASGYTWPELTEKQLERKEQLCRQLLLLADALTPGQTRFRGVLTLELCRTQRHLSVKTRSPDTVRWKEIATLLEEASTILFCEPGWLEELAREERQLKKDITRLVAP